MNQRVIDNECRNYVMDFMDKICEEKGIAHERVIDFGSMAIEVPYHNENGEIEYRWMVVKAVAPRDNSDTWIDEAIFGYEDRIRKDKERAEKKEAERAKTAAKIAKQKAEKEAKAAAIAKAKASQG